MMGLKTDVLSRSRYLERWGSPGLDRSGVVQQLLRKNRLRATVGFDAHTQRKLVSTVPIVPCEFGEVGERLKPHAWKACSPKGDASSNLALSANFGRFGTLASPFVLKTNIRQRWRIVSSTLTPSANFASVVERIHWTLKTSRPKGIAGSSPAARTKFLFPPVRRSEAVTVGTQ